MIIVKHSFFTGGKISACVFVLVVLSFLLNSCKKDTLVESPGNGDSGNCIPIPPYNQVGFGYTTLVDIDNVTQPSFNPNNPSEFCFVKSYPGGNIDLFVYNMDNQSKTLVWSGIAWSPVKWGENDWLIFGASHNVFKIKNTGEDLTQLTQSNNCYFPIWGSSEDYFVCAFHYDIINQPNNNNLTLVHTGMYTSQGVLMDTIKQQFFNRSAVNGNGILVSIESNYSDHNIILVDVNSSDKTVLKNIDNRNVCFKWIDNLSFIWSDVSGLYLTNSSNGETIEIKKTCNSEYYRELDYSHSLNKIICSKISRKLIDNQTIEFKERIVTMNLDGSEEFEVNLN